MISIHLYMKCCEYFWRFHVRKGKSGSSLELQREKDEEDEKEKSIEINQIKKRRI